MVVRSQEVAVTRSAVLSPSAPDPAAPAGVPLREAGRCRTHGTQQALAALLTYQEAVHRGVAERLGVRVDDVEVLLEVDGEHEVRLDVRLTGPDSPEAYDRVRAVVEAHGPVLDLVAG